MTETYYTLREANLARQKEWDSLDQITAPFRANELTGEIGEAIAEVLDMLGYSTALASAGGRLSNVVKKLERERLGIGGKRTTREALTAEIGDIQICLDLLAMSFDIDINRATEAVFNSKSEEMNIKARVCLP